MVAQRVEGGSNRPEGSGPRRKRKTTSAHSVVKEVPVVPLVPEGEKNSSVSYTFSPEIRAQAKLGPAIKEIKEEHKAILSQHGINQEVIQTVHAHSLADRRNSAKGTKEDWAGATALYINSLFGNFRKDEQLAKDGEVGLKVMQAVGIVVAEDASQNSQTTESLITFYKKYGGKRAEVIHQFALDVVQAAGDEIEYFAMKNWLVAHGLLRVFGQDQKILQEMELVMEAAFRMPENTHPTTLDLPAETPENQIEIVRGLGLNTNVAQEATNTEEQVNSIVEPESISMTPPSEESVQQVLILSQQGSIGDDDGAGSLFPSFLQDHSSTQDSIPVPIVVSDPQLVLPEIIPMPVREVLTRIQTREALNDLIYKNSELNHLRLRRRELSKNNVKDSREEIDTIRKETNELVANVILGFIDGRYTERLEDADQYMRDIISADEIGSQLGQILSTEHMGAIYSDNSEFNPNTKNAQAAGAALKRLYNDHIGQPLPVNLQWLLTVIYEHLAKNYENAGVTIEDYRHFAFFAIDGIFNVVALSVKEREALEKAMSARRVTS